MLSKPNGIFLEAIANCGEGVASQSSRVVPFFLNFLPKGLGQVIAIQASGYSMYPTIKSGDVCLFYSPYPLTTQDAKWVDQIYLVSTRNRGLQIKFVTRTLDEIGLPTGINLISLNQKLNLPAVKLDENEVDKIYKFYDRIDDKEFFEKVMWTRESVDE
ncbi:MAG: S24/S26 family peptidase [Phycisphaerae bacterium]|nr:S24/S26 family peptidase [Saprospiraceae bacterium]